MAVGGATVWSTARWHDVGGHDSYRYTSIYTAVVAQQSLNSTEAVSS